MPVISAVLEIVSLPLYNIYIGLKTIDPMKSFDTTFQANYQIIIDFLSRVIRSQLFLVYGNSLYMPFPVRSSS
jgi:hypothetical protein